MPFLPALIIGLILLIYWLRVIYMVRRTKKIAGHGANYIPPEPLGKFLRIIWNPVVALWVLLPFYAAFAKEFPPPLRPLFSDAVISWIAVIIAIVAFALTWICWKKMGK